MKSEYVANFKVKTGLAETVHEDAGEEEAEEVGLMQTANSRHTQKRQGRPAMRDRRAGGSGKRS